jgi:hypothetical protein
MKKGTCFQQSLFSSLFVKISVVVAILNLKKKIFLVITLALKSIKKYLSKSVLRIPLKI